MVRRVGGRDKCVGGSRGGGRVCIGEKGVGGVYCMCDRGGITNVGVCVCVDMCGDVGECVGCLGVYVWICGECVG